MTFYNLPDTDVTIEYDKDKKLLTIANLPDDVDVVEFIDHENGDKRGAYITWGQTTEHPRERPTAPTIYTPPSDVKERL